MEYLPVSLTSGYVSGVSGCFAGNRQFGGAYARWKLLCLAWGKASWPKAFLVKQGREIVHYSFVLPSMARINGIGLDDLEIGPCWTTPALRRRGIMRTCVRKIVADLWSPERTFWMLCREDNLNSCSAVTRAGFMFVAHCDRHRLICGLPIHLFAPDASNLKIDGGAAQPANVAVERFRYNQRARVLLEQEHVGALRILGADGMALPLRSPYEAYHRELARLAPPGKTVLDLCCGDGLHTITGALSGAEVTGLDVAEDGLKIAEKRARIAGTHIRTVHASADDLPFLDGSFDVVSCAGGLSYVDFVKLLSEVSRVLRPDGTLLCVDSFDENPIYRGNRWVHWLRGLRTRQTIRRIPNERTLAQLRQAFGAVQVDYYGILAFCLPVLNWFLDEPRQKQFLDRTDRALIFFRQYAFKIVIRASRPRKPAFSPAPFSGEPV